MSKRCVGNILVTGGFTCTKLILLLHQTVVPGDALQKQNVWFLFCWGLSKHDWPTVCTVKIIIQHWPSVDCPCSLLLLSSISFSAAAVFREKALKFPLFSTCSDTVRDQLVKTVEHLTAEEQIFHSGVGGDHKQSYKNDYVAPRQQVDHMTSKGDCV